MNEELLLWLILILLIFHICEDLPKEIQELYAWWRSRKRETKVF